MLPLSTRAINKALPTCMPDLCRLLFITASQRIRNNNSAGSDTIGPKRSPAFSPIHVCNQPQSPSAIAKSTFATTTKPPWPSLNAILNSP
jgi:hypothetical protein